MLCKGLLEYPLALDKRTLLIIAEAAYRFNEKNKYLTDSYFTGHQLDLYAMY